MVKEDGPWVAIVDNSGITIASGDNYQNATLTLHGDFYKTVDAVKYAEEIAKRLNAYQVREEL
jgi:hypothetical protein|tara:strand:+ start:9931 stop:10119 length:189 start_codon:yes stop_codon:yes gene_type:complete